MLIIKTAVCVQQSFWVCLFPQCNFILPNIFWWQNLIALNHWWNSLSASPTPRGCSKDIQACSTLNSLEDGRYKNVKYKFLPILDCLNCAFRSVLLFNNSLVCQCLMILIHWWQIVVVAEVLVFCFCLVMDFSVTPELMRDVLQPSGENYLWRHAMNIVTFLYFLGKG